MEPVTILGITFRSIYHWYWFIGAMGVLALNSLVAVFAIRRGKYKMEADFAFMNRSIALITSIQAIFFTKLGTVNGPVFSADCIWFNGMLAAVYFTVAYLCDCKARAIKAAEAADIISPPQV